MTVRALKPCPFCGCTPDIENPATFQDSQGAKWGAVVCCCTGPEVRTGYGPVEEWRDDAIEAWNDRREGGWQPIGTIPVNQSVLIWDGESIYVAEVPFEKAGFFVEPMRGRFISETSIVGGLEGPQSPQPTHWMPLPCSPEAEAAS